MIICKMAEVLRQMFLANRIAKSDRTKWIALMRCAEHRKTNLLNGEERSDDDPNTNTVPAGGSSHHPSTNP